jgi:hypothetical protein
MTKIFNHRGQERGPQNISQEIDVRLMDDWDDSIGVLPPVLVCAHDIDCRGFHDVPQFISYVQEWVQIADEDAILAINIKEDGLAPILKTEALDKIGLPKDRYFCFDMSQAEIQHYKKLDLQIATRVSNYGIENPVGDYSIFDWFPEITTCSYTGLMKQMLHGDYCHLFFLGQKVIAISPELHGVNDRKVIDKFWRFCQFNGFWGLCTDLVEEAEGFFNGTDQGDPQ